MDELEKSGKTVDDAVNEALKEMNLTRDEVEITIIEEGSKGFLGMFGAKNAIVKVKRKFNPEKVAFVLLFKLIY